MHNTTIEKVQVRRHTGMGSTRSVWKCEKCNYTSRPMTRGEAEAGGRLHEAQWEHVAEDRDESEPCQAGTVGCCINHDGYDGSCETW